MADRTIKSLLVLIAIALWGLLLRPVMVPMIPATAQAQSSAQHNCILVSSNASVAWTDRADDFIRLVNEQESRGYRVKAFAMRNPDAPRDSTYLALMEK